MRILILMPLDERCVFSSWGLYKELENKDKVLNLVGFTDYMYQTRGKKDLWEVAVASTINSIDSSSYDIVIGNASIEDKFDIIFNMTDGVNQEPYEDLCIKKGEELLNCDFNLHKAEESKLCLIDFKASAELINSLYRDGKDSEEKIQEIKKRYEDRLALGEFGRFAERGSSK